PYKHTDTIKKLNIIHNTINIIITKDNQKLRKFLPNINEPDINPNIIKNKKNIKNISYSKISSKRCFFNQNKGFPPPKSFWNSPPRLPFIQKKLSVGSGWARTALSLQSHSKNPRLFTLVCYQKCIRDFKRREQSGGRGWEESRCEQEWSVGETIGLGWMGDGFWGEKFWWGGITEGGKEICLLYYTYYINKYIK
nr:hypothetical protein 9 - Trypanosoma brucei mitochondrion [Trypanosoma brucei]